MRAGASCRALRAACAALLLTVPCLGDGVSDNGLKPIRRIFVPAGAPDRWPGGTWEPIPLADLERQLAAGGQDLIESFRTGLERAEYRAKLVGDTLQDGTFEWTVRKTPGHASFLALDPLNLAICGLEWIDAESHAPLGAVVWGTTPTKTPGLVLHPSDALAVGAWSLVGRGLARSTEFEVRVPPAMVSHFVLQVPEGLIPTTTAGELAGPGPALEPGFSSWKLHLGSRSSCRLRFSSRIADTARRPLVVARNRTNYDVRPEVVRVLAEFDLEVYETAVSELRLQVDEGLQVVSVEYGDDDEVAWRVVDGSDGRAIVVQLPDSLTGPGQILRVRGISPGKPRQPWSIPRLILPDAVESEAHVTVRLQPPYQAADLQIDGYRQVDLIASPTDGETVVLRQLKAGASLIIVPSSPSLAAICRSVTLARLEGEEWMFTAMVDLRATAGSAFDVSCRVSEGWEIVNVQSDSEPDSGDLAGWEIVTAAGESQLQLDFLTALSPTRPQRVRVTARRNPVELGSELPVPALICPGAVEVDAVSIIIDGPDQRSILQESTGWEVSTLADLPSADQSLDFVRTLPATTRSSAVVLRTNVADSPGTVVLRGLDSAESPKARDDTAGSKIPIAIDEFGKQVGPIVVPLVAVLVDARVFLDGAERGFDRYQINSAVCGSEGAEIRWELPESAQNSIIRLDGRAVEFQTLGTHRMLRLPDSAIEKHESHNLSIEYRVPCIRQFGPNRRRLVFPHFQHPILGCRFKIVVPQSLRLVGPPAGLEIFPEVVETQSIFGLLARPGAESLFHPFGTGDWRRLWEQFEGTSPGPTRTNDTASSNRDRGTDTWSSPQRFDAKAVGETWTGSKLMIPDDLELTIWDRKQSESLSWVVLWLSLLTTVAMRLARLRGGRLTATLVVAVLAGALYVLPTLYAQFCGTSLVSIAIGVLLPQQLLRCRRQIAASDPMSIPSGSTRSFATVSFFSLLTALSLAYAARAQDAPPALADPMLRHVSQARERIDVLIPTGVDGRPAGATPLCYISVDVMDRLRRLQLRREVPPYLLNSAAISATVVDGRQVEVRAKFDVYVLSEDNTVRVELPLTNVVLGGADACLVDGISHPVMLGSDGRGLIVELAGRSARPSPVSMPSFEAESALKSQTAETSTNLLDELQASAAIADAHRIELQLYPLVELELNEAFVARLGIPVLNNTAVEFIAKTESVALSAAPRTGEAAQNFSPELAARSRVVARLRPTGELLFRWSRNRPASQAAAAELTAHVSGLFDVSPALAYSTYQVDYQVHAGAIDALAWKLPRGSTLVSVQSPGMSGYVFESGEGDARRLFLEFAAPQTGNIVVTATLAQPLPRGSVEMDLPLLELDATPGRAGHTTLGRYQVAFRQPVDYRLKVAASALNLSLKPRAIDDFLKNWPVGGTQPPQQAFELIRAGELRLTLQELPAGLTAKTESRGHFGRGRLDWTFIAEIEPPVVPPFQYRLQVDPRLRIRKVSVREDGAEQLLRWSHLNDTLILFLNNRAVRSQVLKVEATMPTANSPEVELPTIELEGVPYRPSVISLTRGPEVQATLLGEVATDQDKGSLSGRHPSQPGESLSVGRIEVGADHLSPRVLIEDTVPVTSVEIATILRRVGNENTLTTAVDYEVRSGKVLQFEIELPADLAQRGRIETNVAAEAVRRSVAEGRVALVFFPLQPVTDRFRVTLKVPAVVPTSGEWTVPGVTAVGVPVAARSLILASDYAVELEPSALPDWIPALFDSEFDIARIGCYKLPADELATTVHLSSNVRSEDLPDTLADVAIEYQADGALIGRYVFWLPSRPPDEIVFDWPQAADPVAVFVDDRPQAVPAPTKGIWTLPLPGNALRNLICVMWVERGRPLMGMGGEVHPMLPAPRNVPVATALLNMQIAPRLAARHRQDATGHLELEVALDRWQAGLSAIERQSDQQDTDGGLWVADYVRQSAAEVTRLTSNASDPFSPQQYRRIELLSRRASSIKPAIPRADGRHSESFASVLLDEPLVGDQRAPDSIVRSISKSGSTEINTPAISGGIWVFDRLAVNSLLGSLFGLVVALTIWKTIPFWVWLQRREALVWIVLGFFWWLTLKVGVFGLLLMAFGVVRLAMRGARDESDSLPVTINT